MTGETGSKKALSKATPGIQVRGHKGLVREILQEENAANQEIYYFDIY